MRVEEMACAANGTRVDEEGRSWDMAGSKSRFNVLESVWAAIVRTRLDTSYCLAQTKKVRSESHFNAVYKSSVGDLRCYES